MPLSNHPALTGHALAMRLRGSYSFFRRLANAALAPLKIPSYENIRNPFDK